MKTQLIRIGNSQGVRIPKPLIDEIGLQGEIDLQVREGSLVIKPSAPRQGWSEAAAFLSKERSGLLDEVTPTDFDEDEWQW